MISQLNPKTRVQIASEYGIDYKTLMRRLKKQEIDLPSGLIYPKNQKKIYESLGYTNAKLKADFHHLGSG
jgi:hypothetical protein